MKSLIAASALVLCSVAVAEPPGKRASGPMVVVTTGRLLVLGNELNELRGKLNKADRLIGEAQKSRIGGAPLAELLSNARNRLDNAREYLAIVPPEEKAQFVGKEGREDDERMADAVLSGRLVVADLDSVHHELARADFNLAQAEAKLGGRGPGPSVTEARAALQGAREVLAQLGGQQLLPPPPPVSAEPPLPPLKLAGARPHVWPISDQAFNDLMAAMEQQSFADDRLRVLEAASQTQFFYVAHVQKLLAKFVFAQQRLKAVQLVRNRILDPQNNFQLFQAFQFPAEKEELKRILTGNPDSALPQPMAPQALDALIEKIRASYTYALWYKILGDEAAQNWFLIDQVAAIAVPFPTYDARMRAVEILKPRILDPQNYSRLEPLFSTQADRERLKALFVQ